MAPIRVGIIGIGATKPKLGPGSWGVVAHLVPLLASPHYEIVALCNSSVESAQRAIKFHNLPSTIKPYGNVEELANDPDIDLISVSVVVYKHLLVAKPALLAKKQVFVEWPLGASTAEAEELLSLAKKANVKTIVGAQLRSDPWIIKVKELIDSGAIGKVLSTEALLCSLFGPKETWLADADYYVDFKSGGNDYHIAFAHFLDSFTHVLGGFATVKSTFAIQHPLVNLVDGDTGKVVKENHPKTAPDHIVVQGKLESGALAGLSFRSATPVDGKSLRWIISGTEGEIELLAEGAGVQMGGDDRTIKIKKAKDEGEAEVVEWRVDEPDYIKNVAYPGKNTARLYEAFAVKKVGSPDFEEALKLHKLLDRIAKDAGFL